MSVFIAVVVAFQFGVLSSAERDGDGKVLPGIPDSDWDDVFARREGWTGGDGMFTVPLGDDTTLWLFSDTWIGKVEDGGHAPGSRLVNNSVARHVIAKDGQVPKSKEVFFHWGSNDKEGHPRAWIRPETDDSKSESWYWLADGIVTKNGNGNPRLTVFLWRIERAEGKGIMNFRSAGGDIAIVENPHDPLSKWRVRQVSNPHAVSASSQENERIETSWGTEILVDPESDGRKLLVFGVREAGLGNKQILVARIPAEEPEGFGDWEFRTARGWSSKPADAIPIVENISNEYSITPVTKDGQTVWVLVYSEPIFGSRIFVRVSKSPLGPWSEPTAIFRVPELARHKDYFTYAAKGHPELSRPGELLVTYVVNSFDFGTMVRDASIYRPRFVRLPLDEVPFP